MYFGVKGDVFIYSLRFDVSVVYSSFEMMYLSLSLVSLGKYSRFYFVVYIIHLVA